jgi:hypothetical protein
MSKFQERSMKHAGSKAADEIIVLDSDAAMERTKEAIRHILTIPKPDSIAQSSRRKNRKGKK